MTRSRLLLAIVLSALVGVAVALGTGVSVSVVSSAPASLAQPLSVPVSTGVLNIWGPLQLPYAGTKKLYDVTINIVNTGVAPFKFTARASTPLPAGLTLDPAKPGRIFGTCSTVGDYVFTLDVVDAVGAKGWLEGVKVSCVPPLLVDFSALPTNVTVGQVCDFFIKASGGKGPYTFAVTKGVLPPSLKIGSDGHVTGTITGMPGNYDFDVTVTDSTGSIVIGSLHFNRAASIVSRKS